MAKRKKTGRKRRQKNHRFGGNIQFGPHHTPIEWVEGDIATPEEISQATDLLVDLREVVDAGFAEEEVNELAADLLEKVTPKIRGLCLYVIAQEKGEPVTFTDDNASYEGMLQELDDGNFKLVVMKVPDAKFGVRVSQREGREFYMTADQAPGWLTDEEREAWAKSPALAIALGLADKNDTRWMQFFETVEGRSSGSWEEETITAFTHLQASMLKISREETGKVIHTMEEQTPTDDEIRYARVAWAAMRNARIFHIDPFIFTEIYHQCDVYTEEVVAGFGKGAWKPAYSGPLKSDEQNVEYVRRLKEASTYVPMPDHFPFEVMYLGYGPGIHLKREQVGVKFSAFGFYPPENVNDIRLMGTLITESGWVFECIRFAAVTEDEEKIGYAALPIRFPDKGFTPTIDLGPWYSTKLVDFVNSHRAYVIEDDVPARVRSAMRKVRKDGSKKKERSFWIPPPYYRIRMKDRIVRERARELIPTMASRNATYRTDRIGHPRLYVRRGPLPLDPERREKLVEREYLVYETTNPPPEIRGELLRKGHLMKKPDEWMAIREIWIEQTMTSTDESLPYVPAMRTTGPRKKLLTNEQPGDTVRE